MVVAVACQVLGPGDTADTEGPRPLPSEALHSRVGMGVLKKINKSISGGEEG